MSPDGGDGVRPTWTGPLTVSVKHMYSQCVYIYIYIEREREIDRDRDRDRERESERDVYEHSSREENLLEDGLAKHHIRGRRAVSAAGLQGMI